METLSLFDSFFVFFAGIISVFSPCVFPLLPIIMTGSGEESKFRPLAIVMGLTLSFMIMGVLTTLFSSLIFPYINMIEKLVGLFVILFGVTLLFDLNIFKKLTLLKKMPKFSSNLFGAFLLGFTLGIVWIPCIGPMLSSVLATVATAETLSLGLFLLLIYSVGFAIPLLVAGYATQFFRKKVGTVMGKASMIRIVSGVILIIFGLSFYIPFN